MGKMFTIPSAQTARALAAGPSGTSWERREIRNRSSQVYLTVSNKLIYKIFMQNLKTLQNIETFKQYFQKFQFIFYLGTASYFSSHHRQPLAFTGFQFEGTNLSKARSKVMLNLILLISKLSIMLLLINKMVRGRSPRNFPTYFLNFGASPQKYLFVLISQTFGCGHRRSVP